jgi:paired small multidrug resistance pump
MSRVYITFVVIQQICGIAFHAQYGVERMEFFHRLLDKFDWLIAGLFGALVATRWHKDDLTDRKSWLLFLLTGMACAHYLTGMVSAYFGIIEPRSVAGVGFLLGTFGGSLMAAITRAIKAADLWSFIRSKFGGPSP